MSGTIVKHRFSLSTGARDVIRMAVLYLECRPLSTDERSADRRLFDRATDSIARTEATADLMAAAAHRLAYHRLILSPGDAAGALNRDDMLRWTRSVIADLERRQGRQLTWVAAMHRHTRHPHVHVLIGATARSSHGVRSTVRFTRADYEALRRSGDRWLTQVSANQMLLREVEYYLSIAANTVASRMVRHNAGEIQNHDEDIEEEQHRWDTRRR